MTEKQLRYMRAFLVDSSEFVIDDNTTHERLKRYDILDRLNELNDENEQLKKQRYDLYMDIARLVEENEQLKQFPIKLDNRIQKLEEDLKALKEMETDDLNPQAIEDVAIVIGMSLNALKEFKKELKGDVK